MKFSRGDAVVCINGKKWIDEWKGWIVENGRKYVVDSCYSYEGKEMVYLTNNSILGINLLASRFELAEDYETNPVLRKIKKMEERFNKRKVSCAA